MSRISRAFGSSIGSKAVVAVTGVLMFLFLVGHLAGNLLIYKGPESVNNYAASLRALGPLLWVIRGGLILIAALHIISTVRLTLKNRAARPVGYQRNNNVQLALSARTMVWTGLLVLAYLVYHLLQFTFRVTEPSFATLTDAHGRHDVYAMTVLGFRQLPIAAMYVLATALLAFHLMHGTRSFLQTLGFHPDENRVLRSAGPLLAFLMFAGFASIPTTIQLGWITLVR